jgi:16S rRNA (cytosine967-C5)-methyltransferase
VKRGRPAAGARNRRRRAPPGARELALQILLATEGRSAYSDRVLESKLRDAGLKGPDSALVTALVQGTLRHQALLDHHLDAFTGGRLATLPAPIRCALRLGAFQILILTRVPESAAVDQSVELAKRYGHPGTAGLVNAVLRRLAGGERAPLPDPETNLVDHLAVTYSHPRWLVARWVGRYGEEEATQLLASDNSEPLVSVRPNLHRTKPAAFVEALRAEGHGTTPAPNGGPVFLVERGFVAARSPLFRQGLLTLQDEAEAVVALLLDPAPGERVLDLCAAPGGKSAQIAERIAPGGKLLALERHKSRALALRSNMVDRLRLPGVHVVCGDGRNPPLIRPFDRVLVDAPCTGLGVLRRRADARWRKEEGAIRELAAMQRALLDGAAPLVRPGGVLVYSVCSLEPEETDEVVESFLRTHPEFEREDVRPFLPPGFATSGPDFRAYPHRHGTDGVFASRMVRR